MSVLSVKYKNCMSYCARSDPNFGAIESRTEGQGIGDFSE